MNRWNAVSKWALAALVLACCAAASAEGLPETWDGLVQVKAKRVDGAYLLPGADFSRYARVMLDPTEVAFRNDWVKEAESGGSVMRRGRITDEEVAEILAVARANFDEVFHAAFVKAGHELADQPASDVLRISTAVVNLFINASEAAEGPGRSEVLTANAGEATIVVELRDSMSNALLARAIDRSATRSTGMLEPASRARNLEDFRQLFGHWGELSAEAVTELKAHPPIPRDLKPLQAP